MKTINLIILCMTSILIILGIGFFVWSDAIAESPYEQCLDSCYYADKITCTHICNEDFKEAIEILAEKFIPLIEKIIEEGYIK